MDTYEGDPQSPLSLHKYLDAGADPPNRLDPNGMQDFDIGSLTTAISIASTLASMSNVLVAGLYSALTHGLPDAVGFGAFVAGPEDLREPLVGGIEVVFAPRLEKEAVYVFLGFEPAWSTPISPVSSLAEHSLVERGAFAVWYWGLPDLDSGPFAIAPGLSAGGGFVSQEFSAGGETSLLFGISSDLDISLFGVAGYGQKVWEGTLSEPAMVTEAGLTETAFSSLGLVESGSSISGVGGLAAAIINGAAVSTWVGFTYGKEVHQ